MFIFLGYHKLLMGLDNFWYLKVLCDITIVVKTLTEMSMGLSFEQKLRNYARLGLLHGLGMDQKIRPLYIESYQIEDHNHFIPIMAEEAYKIGVQTVDVRYRYPELERVMMRDAPEEFKLYFPGWITDGAKRIIERDGARIALNGNGDLGVMDDVDSKYSSRLKSAFMKANEPYSTLRMKMLRPWSILDVPTKAWAKKLGMNVRELWEFLFSVTGADQKDCLKFAQTVNEQLHRRCDLLNKLGIATLHFVGDKTDLRVGLSPRARWLGGRKQSEDGTWFEPNWPSFEVFTTPDWRKTEGSVTMTLPSVLDGPIVENLRVWFSAGRAVHSEATAGNAAFKDLITTDASACQLGEIALVGFDSPLAKYAYPHFCGLLDENKRCHLAFGEAYPAALEGGTTATREELVELGCNESDIHHDMMISDRHTSVTAYDASGKRLAQLISGGCWIGEFT